MWCGGPLPERRSRGPAASYCRAACRQAAYRARQPATPAAPAPAPAVAGTPPGWEELVGRLAVARGRVVGGEEFAGLDLYRAAVDLLEVSGRPVPDAPPPPPGRSHRPAAPRVTATLPGPPAKRLGRRFTRRWEDTTGWEVTVTALRPAGPAGRGRPLWRRLHPADGTGRGGRVLELTDPWGVPRRGGYHNLALCILAETLDLPGTSTTTLRAATPQVEAVAARYAATVLYPYGDTAWTIDSTTVLDWLDQHDHLDH